MHKGIQLRPPAKKVCFHCAFPISGEYRVLQGKEKTLYLHPLCAQIMHDGLMKDVEEIERLYPDLTSDKGEIA